MVKRTADIGKLYVILFFFDGVISLCVLLYDPAMRISPGWREQIHHFITFSGSVTKFLYPYTILIIIMMLMSRLQPLKAFRVLAIFYFGCLGFVMWIQNGIYTRLSRDTILNMDHDALIRFVEHTFPWLEPVEWCLCLLQIALSVWAMKSCGVIGHRGLPALRAPDHTE